MIVQGRRTQYLRSGQVYIAPALPYDIESYLAVFK